MVNGLSQYSRHLWSKRIGLMTTLTTNSFGSKIASYRTGHENVWMVPSHSNMTRFASYKKPPVVSHGPVRHSLSQSPTKAPAVSS
jgi:hypothetical protein